MPLLRRVTLLQAFSVISLIGVIAIGSGLGVLISNQLEELAVARARDQLGDMIRDRAGYPPSPGAKAIIDLTPAEFSTLHNSPADYKAWNAQVFRMFESLPIYRVKVWRPDSTIVWADDGGKVIGQTHPENAELQDALRGEVKAELSSLDKVENLPDRGAAPTLLELYVPLMQRGTFQQLGVFEVYEDIGTLTDQIRTAQALAWGGISLGLGVLYLVLVGLVANASRTISRLRHLSELERYFSPAVARAIAAGDTAGASSSAVFSLGRRGNLSQRLLTHGEITVLFTDIRGFTRQAEQMDAEEVVELLNAYMDVVTTAVFNHNGSIDKFLGDGVLAVFGAPLPDPNHALDAVRAVQELRIGLAELNRRRQAAGQVPIVIGAAVTTGLAVTGNIGSAKQLSFTVTGDTVNLGARLVGIAQPEQVLISARTYDLMQRDAVSGEDTGPWAVQGPFTVAIRGREEPATIYNLAPDLPAAPAIVPPLAAAVPVGAGGRPG